MTDVERCYKKLGIAIKARRTELGLTAAALAKKANISRPALVNMEQGRQRIYLHHLLKLEKLLKASLMPRKN